MVSLLFYTIILEGKYNMIRLLIVVGIVSTALCIISMEDKNLEERSCRYNIKYCPCVDGNACPED